MKIKVLFRKLRAIAFTQPIRLAVMAMSCSAILSAFPFPAEAAYTVDPLRIELDMPENTNVVTTSVRIHNNGTETIRLKAYLENWTLDEGGGLQLLTREKTSFDIAENVRFNPKEFEVAPNATQVIRLAISLPPEAKDGEYRGMLFFEDLKTESQRFTSNKGFGASVQIKQRFGMALYTYKGQPKPLPHLKTFDCRMESGKLKTAIELENKGNRHVRVTSSLLVFQKDAQGNKKPFKEIPINDLHDIIILPNQNRKIEQVLAPTEALSEFPAGDYQLELHFSDASFDTNLPTANIHVAD